MSGIQSLLEALKGKTIDEMSQEELQEVTQTRRRDMTAILESDLSAEASSGPRAVSQRQKLKAEMEDAL